MKREAALAAQLTPAKDVVEAVERTGFLRTLGGVEAYVALWARVPGFKAKDVDAALADRRLAVIPAVRGCMYVVPKRDVPSALRIAALLAKKAADRTNEKAGIKKGELEKLGAQVIALLEKEGALSTDALRKQLTIRKLGDKAKAAGVSSPLPPALDLLEWSGKIERTPESGRLDSQRYVWRVAKSGVPGDSLAEVLARMAEIFLRGAGIGTAKDFACWAGVSQRDANAAIAETGAKEVEGGFTVGHEELDGVNALLPFEDNLLAYHGGPALFTDPRFHSLQVPQWGSGGKGPLVGARHLSYRPVIGDGKVIGFWEWDPKPREVAMGFFDAPSASAKRALEERAAALGRLLRDELGHGRSFSLDTDEECAKRAAWVRKLRPATPRKAAGKRPRA